MAASSLDPSGPNAGYVSQLLELYLDNPEAVDPEWREAFERAGEGLLSTLPGLGRLRAPAPRDGNGAPASVPIPEPAPAPSIAVPPAPRLEPDLPVVAPEATEGLLAAVASATALVGAIRTHGHLAARLDPLGSEPLGDPALEESELAFPLSEDEQAEIPASILGVHVEGETLADVLPRLREVYMGTIAYEIEHISDHAERLWLRRAIESGRFRRPLAGDERRALLARLAQVDGVVS
jgi:2-oxoglutarate dehydrogenase E1 component